MFQRHVIVGNLGADPEMRYTPTGQPYTRFNVAVNRRWADADGNTQEETTWFRVVAWGKLAEACSQYLAKGRPVLVEGNRLHASAYVNRDNQPAATLELTARTVRFLGAGGKGAAEAEGAVEGAEDDQTEVLPL